MTYNDDNRGVIQCRERRQQIIDASGLRFGNITPTDCDGLIEYKDKAYVLFEIKYRDAPVPKGQLVALTRSIDDYTRAGKHAVLIIAEHEVDNPKQDIIAAICKVRTYYYHGTWYKKECTLKDFIEKMIAFVDRRN